MEKKASYNRLYLGLQILIVRNLMCGMEKQFLLQTLHAGCATACDNRVHCMPGEATCISVKHWVIDPHKPAEESIIILTQQARHRTPNPFSVPLFPHQSCAGRSCCASLRTAFNKPHCDNHYNTRKTKGIYG